VSVAKIRLGGAAERDTGTKLPAADDEDAEEEAWIDLMKLGSVFSHEGSNLYLRLWQLGQSLCRPLPIRLHCQSPAVNQPLPLLAFRFRSLHCVSQKHVTIFNDNSSKNCVDYSNFGVVITGTW